MPPTQNSNDNTDFIQWAYNDAKKQQPTKFKSFNRLNLEVYDLNDHYKIFLVDQNQPQCYLALIPYQEGFKVRTVALTPALRGKNIPLKLYVDIVEHFQKPLYSDSTQTDASRKGIWLKLISEMPDRVVGYDPQTRQNLPITHTDQGPMVNNNQPIYVDRKQKDINKPVTDKKTARTRLLKLLPNIMKENNTPQPGISSGKPITWKKSAKIKKIRLSIEEILNDAKLQSSIPYYKDIIDDYDKKDYSWGVFTKVLEYAKYLKKHPETIQNLPPIIFVDNRLQDGAHRISAIWLLQNRLDPNNNLWKNFKLKVEFGKTSDIA